jgi:hypothetical protein
MERITQNKKKEGDKLFVDASLNMFLITSLKKEKLLEAPRKFQLIAQ